MVKLDSQTVFDNVKNALNELASHNKAHRKVSRRMEKRAVKAEEENEVLRKKLEELERQNKKLTKRNKKLKQENNDLQTENDELKEENNRLHTKTERLETMNDELKESRQYWADEAKTSRRDVNILLERVKAYENNQQEEPQEEPPEEPQEEPHEEPQFDSDDDDDDDDEDDDDDDSDDDEDECKFEDTDEYSPQQLFSAFRTLNLSLSSTKAGVRKRYLHLARQFHPDKSDDEESTEKFRQIKEAYDYIMKFVSWPAPRPKP